MVDRFTYRYRTHYCAIHVNCCINTKMDIDTDNDNATDTSAGTYTDHDKDTDANMNRDMNTEIKTVMKKNTNMPTIASEEKLSIVFEYTY